LRGPTGDLGVDRIAVRHHRGDEFAGQSCGRRVAFVLGQVPLQDGVGGALPEVRFEDGR
jgi:hypothetical protein